MLLRVGKLLTRAFAKQLFWSGEKIADNRQSAAGQAWLFVRTPKRNSVAGLPQHRVCTTKAHQLS